VYLSWLILLFGGSVAFYAQHPEYLYTGGGEPRLSNRMRERLALSVMNLVAGRFLSGERMPTLPEFTRRLGMPMHALQLVLDVLESRELVVQSTDDPPVYLPARDPALITVAQVFDTLRAAGEERFLSPEAMPVPQPVDEVLDRMQQAVASSVGNITLRDLAEQCADGAVRNRAVREDA
jgi:membrane protein